MEYWIFPSALALVLLGCAAEASDQADCSNVELQERDKGWAAAAFQRNLDALMAFYHDNAVQLPPGGPVIEGKNELRELFIVLFADPDYSLTWSLEAVKVSRSCDLGYTRGTWTIIRRGSDGKLVESTGKYLGVWVKDDAGNWVVLEDIFNTETKHVIE